MLGRSAQPRLGKPCWLLALGDGYNGSASASRAQGVGRKPIPRFEPPIRSKGTYAVHSPRSVPFDRRFSKTAALRTKC